MVKSRMRKMNFCSFNLNQNRGGGMSLKKRMNAGFQSIRNFEHQIKRKKMDNQWSILKFSATLLAFIMGLAILLGSPEAMAAEKMMVKDPSTGKMVVAPEYGGSLTFTKRGWPANTDTLAGGRWASQLVFAVLDKPSVADWGINRDTYALHMPWV